MILFTISLILFFLSIVLFILSSNQLFNPKIIEIEKKPERLESGWIVISCSQTSLAHLWDMQILNWNYHCEHKDDEGYEAKLIEILEQDTFQDCIHNINKLITTKSL